MLRTLTVADAPAFAAHISADLTRLSEFLPWPSRTEIFSLVGSEIDRANR